MWKIEDNPLTQTFQFNWCSLAVAIALAQVAVALISGMLRASENISPKKEPKRYLKWSVWFAECGHVWRGYLTPHKDRFVPAMMGFVELCIYPFAMRLGAWDYIGYWIGLKTVAQWSAWTKDRSVFNRYLLGNVAVVAASFIIAKYVISLNAG